MRLYVNPACSKSRRAVELLDEHVIDAEHVHYLDSPPSVSDLEQLMVRLGIDDPRLMMRTSEPAFLELGLAGASRDSLLEAITEHPILLERPIFVRGDQAVVARPPERLLELL